MPGSPSARLAWLAVWVMLVVDAPVFAAGDDELLVGQVSHVADGDTLTITADGVRQRIRLHQIDAPERHQPGSVEARRALSDKVAGKYVRVQTHTMDDYGRLVGTVWLGNRDVNRELVREGHAWAYRRYLEDRSLLEDEAAAREAGRGLWGLPDPQPPWRWRQAARTAGDRLPGDCVIKGNINRRGERIYHRPGDRYYADTRIDTSSGERWFCSTREAERGGWRRAR